MAIDKYKGEKTPKYVEGILNFGEYRSTEPKIIQIKNYTDNSL